MGNNINTNKTKKEGQKRERNGKIKGIEKRGKEKKTRKKNGRNGG
jgi:hypothetical protein